MSDQPQSPDSPSPQSRPPVEPTFSTPPPPPPGYAPPVYAPPPAPRSGVMSKIATTLITTVLFSSLLANLYLGSFFVGSIRSGPRESEYQAGDSDQRIVILPIQGMINAEQAEFVRQAIKVLDDSPPAAIILRTDTGGGLVAPSDRIWNLLRQYKQDHPDIPIIASFGSITASGGYYIAAVSDHIIAEPTTLTGSIGVISQGFTVERLLDKIGVTPEISTSTRSIDKAFLDISRPRTEEDRQKLRLILDDAYDRFVDVVHQGRKHVLDKDQVLALATGRIFTAKEALENKLVDEIAYLDRAIEVAKEKAGLDAEITPQVTLMRRPQGISLLGMLHTSRPGIQLPGVESLSSAQVRSWLLEMGVPRLAYMTTGP